MLRKGGHGKGAQESALKSSKCPNLKRLGPKKKKIVWVIDYNP